MVVYFLFLTFFKLFFVALYYSADLKFSAGTFLWFAVKINSENYFI